MANFAESRAVAVDTPIEARAGAETAYAPLSGVHIGALDGIRGLAILLVLLFHYGRSARGMGFDNILLTSTELGWIGVDLFFVLSGFLITGILYDSRNSKHYFRNFYARRTLRIFPLYYAAVFVVFFLAAVWPSAGIWPEISPLWFIFYLSNVAMSLPGTGGVGVLAHFWSLAIEEHFYLLWPAIVFLFPRRRRLMAIAAGLVAFSLSLRLVALTQGMDPGSVYVLTPMRFDALAVGAICSLAVRAPGGAAALVRPATVAMIGGGLAVLAIVVVRRTLSPNDDIVMQTIGYTLLAGSFGGTLLLGLAWQTLGDILSNPVLRWFGRYSYGIYVWHPIVNVILFYTSIKAALGIEGATLSILYLLFAFCTTLLVSLASYHFWEKRFLMLKSRFA